MRCEKQTQHTCINPSDEERFRVCLTSKTHHKAEINPLADDVDRTNVDIAVRVVHRERLAQRL